MNSSKMSHYFLKAPEILYTEPREQDLLTYLFPFYAFKVSKKLIL